MFIECFNEETRDQLIENGHRLLNVRNADGGKIWLFAKNYKNPNFANIDTTQIKETKTLTF